VVVGKAFALPQRVCLRILAGLCPEKQVSGGKVFYTCTREVKNRAAIALRLGHTASITLRTTREISTAR
jgi:hypothetical protein